MRSPNPWNANNVYESTPTGTLNNNEANNQNGCVSDESSPLTQGETYPTER